MMEREHIVRSYDEELVRLDNLIVEMGGQVETQLEAALDALVKRDRESAERIRRNDKRIDAFEEEISAFAIQMIALRQPMADDLREVVGALKISADLERMGDHAKNIAKRTIALCDAPQITGAANSIMRMGRLVLWMIHNVLDAFTERDTKLAADVLARDEEVDQIHTSLFRELLTYMMEDPRSISSCTHLLFIAKNVERIGDHGTNIAEQIYFMEKGHPPDEDRPKSDESSFTVVEPEDVETENDGET